MFLNVFKSKDCLLFLFVDDVEKIINLVIVIVFYRVKNSF